MLTPASLYAPSGHNTVPRALGSRKSYGRTMIYRWFVRKQSLAVWGKVVEERILPDTQVLAAALA